MWGDIAVVLLCASALFFCGYIVGIRVSEADSQAFYDALIRIGQEQMRRDAEHEPGEGEGK